MSSKTEEILEIIARELQVPKARILERSLKTYLERRLREVEVEIFRISSRHGVSSVEDMEKRYREGTLEEADSWEDFQRFDHLEYDRDRLVQWLGDLE